MEDHVADVGAADGSGLGCGQVEFGVEQRREDVVGERLELLVLALVPSGGELLDLGDLLLDGGQLEGREQRVGRAGGGVGLALHDVAAHHLVVSAVVDEDLGLETAEP